MIGYRISNRVSGASGEVGDAEYTVSQSYLQLEEGGVWSDLERSREIVLVLFGGFHLFHSGCHRCHRVQYRDMAQQIFRYRATRMRESETIRSASSNLHKTG